MKKNENSSWNSDIVTRILKNETYIGTLIQNKKRVNYRIHKIVDLDRDDWIIIKNHHKAIIIKETFNKVQKILNNVSNRVNKNSEYDILSGYVKCADCGKIMITKKGKNKEYYYCSSYINNVANILFQSNY